jgi:signal transduction histidine kinase
VQYLAKELSLATVSYKDTSRRLNARVRWDEAVQAGDLTEAKVEYSIEKSAVGFSQGTRVVLAQLNQIWGEREVEGLAEQLWMLTPPFKSTLAAGEDLKSKFDIEFRTQNSRYKSIFETRLRAVLDIWDAKLVGSNNKGNAIVSLQFKGEREPLVKEYSIVKDPSKEKVELDDGDFEIRVFKLQGRLPGNITVDDARSYFNRFGGVHVYDGGFHLPFYGDPKNDWLQIEFDHSHRLTLSQLLPDGLQVSNGMSYLPTLSRLYGVVNIDTSNEKVLKLLITRDRLQESKALEQLVFFVRWALDFYATEIARREAAALPFEAEIVGLKATDLRQALQVYEKRIPEDVYRDLQTTMEKVSTRFESQAERVAKQATTLGPLATAGIATLAAQHEIKRQFSTFEDLISRIRNVKPKDNASRRQLEALERDLTEFYERLKRTNNLFSYFADRDLRERARLPAKKTIETVVGQLSILMRGINIRTHRLDPTLALPRATFAEWSSIFQNVLINAYNAMLDTGRKDIDISSKVTKEGYEVLVQDTGVGVDLKEGERFFKPFERGIELSEDMRAIGYGGTGLGLTIVRLVATRAECKVSFVEPERGYSTAFSLRWSEDR